MVTSHQNITSIPLQQNKNLGENKTRPETITVGEKLCIIGLNFVLLYFSALQSRSVHHWIRGNCRVAFLSALNAMFGSCCHFLGTCDCWCGRCCSGAGRKIPERERGKAKKRGALEEWDDGKGGCLDFERLVVLPFLIFPIKSFSATWEGLSMPLLKMKNTIRNGGTALHCQNNSIYAYIYC